MNFMKHHNYKTETASSQEIRALTITTQHSILFFLCVAKLLFKVLICVDQFLHTTCRCSVFVWAIGMIVIIDDRAAYSNIMELKLMHGFLFLG